MRHSYKMSVFFGVWFMAVAGMVLLSWLPETAPPEAYFIDKILHFTAFFVLTFASLRLTKHLLLRVSLAAFMCLIGALIELVQQGIARRQGSWEDLIADILGVFLAFAIAQIYDYDRQ